MEIKFYTTTDFAPEIVQAGRTRDWMDAYESKNPYRCLPMIVANSHGWELLCPETIFINWNGGQDTDDLTVNNTFGQQPSWAYSLFQRGVLTFHPHYLVRTPKGWWTRVQGKPNQHKDGISPMTADVETDWAPFTFTMNYQLTRPGTVAFEKGECFCFVFPFRKLESLEMKPVIENIASNSTLEKEYKEWYKARDGITELKDKEAKRIRELNTEVTERYNKARAKLNEDQRREYDEIAKKHKAVKCPLTGRTSQLHYTRGEKINGPRGDFDHTTKVIFAEPTYADGVKVRHTLQE